MRRFLKNPIYVGEIHFMDVVIKDKFPAIVDKETFNKVQEKLKTNRKKSASFKADDKCLLSYKLFYGDCGGLMVGECTLKKKLERLIVIISAKTQSVVIAVRWHPFRKVLWKKRF